MLRRSPRVVFGAAALCTMVIGLWVHHDAPLGAIARDVLGDALWAAMIMWMAGAVAPGASLIARAAVALALCTTVEFSQLVHGTTLDAIRRTTLGHLVLGSGFDPRDLLAYASGVAAVAALEGLVRSRLRSRGPCRRVK